MILWILLVSEEHRNAIVVVLLKSDTSVGLLKCIVRIMKMLGIEYYPTNKIYTITYT